MLEYQEILPDEKLRPFIKYYFLIWSDVHVDFKGKKMPDGHIEVVFNLGDARWVSNIGDKVQVDPPVELLGQLTGPLSLQLKGRTYLLGIKFYPHTARYFFNDSLNCFTNQISNLCDVAGTPVKRLYELLLNEPLLQGKIDLIETFLIAKLISAEPDKKMQLISKALKDLQSDTHGGIEQISRRHGVSSRYLQKIFLENTGISPKTHNLISRFQIGLKHLTEKETSLTATAYESGYADQSHFIRDFKKFAGKTPSAYLTDLTPVILLAAHTVQPTNSLINSGVI